MAEQGFLLLGDRLRSDEEKEVVFEVIVKHCLGGPNSGAALDLRTVYNANKHLLHQYLQDREQQLLPHENTPALPPPTTTTPTTTTAVPSLKKSVASGIGRVSLTNALSRVFTLVSAAVEMSEPVLLVGESFFLFLFCFWFFCPIYRPID